MPKEQISTNMFFPRPSQGFSHITGFPVFGDFLSSFLLEESERLSLLRYPPFFRRPASQVPAGRGL